jgi:hypothetical protein
MKNGSMAVYNDNDVGAKRSTYLPIYPRSEHRIEGELVKGAACLYMQKRVTMQ